MNKRKIILCCMLFCSFCTAQQYTITKDIRYHPDTSLSRSLTSLDIYRPFPEIISAPVVIYIHGGGWTSGDKGEVDKKASFFTSNGYIFVSINYRLSPFPFDTANTLRLKYPVHEQDAAFAVSWVRKNISHFGGDSTKIGIIGHSAGAHIALLLGTKKTFLEGIGTPLTAVRCICSLDIGGIDIPVWNTRTPGDRTVYINAFGNDEMTLINASPARNIQAGLFIPPILHIHQNTPERKDMAALFKERMSLQGYLVTTASMDTLDHNEISMLIGDSTQPVLNGLVKSFFCKYLKPEMNVVSQHTNNFPVDPVLFQNYPNPFNPSTTIRYYNPSRQHVILIVYDILGRELARPVDEQQEAGSHSIQFIGNFPASGIYFYTFRTDNFIQTKKMTILK